MVEIEMIDSPIIETERLILRQWRDDDLDAFAQMSMDPRVMAFFPSVQDRQTCQDTVAWIAASFAEVGFAYWSVEIKGASSFVGLIGLSIPSFQATFTPCVEVGWRLAHDYWGHGYATEGALASLKFGFETKGLNEIVAFCVHNNMASRAVMERIGMTRDVAGDFDHPSLDPASPLCPHVLYRIAR
jgi:RimJ/RimL family protein N-acetyltransferase